MMELLDALDAESTAKAATRKAIRPLVEQCLGTTLEDARRNYASWDYTWDTKNRVLTINRYDAGGYMDSQWSRTKTWRYTEDELNAIPFLGGSFSFT